MPIYEFICLDCGRESSFLTPSYKTCLEPKCRTCGSPNLRKLVSRVAVFRSTPSGHEGGEDWQGGEGNFPGEMGDGGSGGSADDDGPMGDDLE